MDPNEVVYISNIPKQATLADLHGFLKSCGNIVGAAFMRENRNDCRTKIAFVLFENTKQAMDACSLDQTLFQAHRLSVLLSNDDRKFLAGYTIMIENTSSDTSEEDLFEACCRYGSVEAVQIPTNYYAFVGFAERSAAHAAQRKLDNALLKMQKVQVKVLNEDVRVRLEDLDSFKTPRVYNELLRAKQQYYNSQQQNDNSGASDVQHMEDEYHDEQYDNNNEGYENMDRQFTNDAMIDDYEVVRNNECYFEEENNQKQVYRRDIKLGKPRYVPANSTSVKVENVPREVYDEDVVIYFQQFGPIVSMERGICISSIFTKVYTFTYQDEASQSRAINCFRREINLSGINCTIFTMKPGDALRPVKKRCLLISYLAHHVTYSEVMETFANIGDILYIEKRVRNNGPTIIHFSHNISLNEARNINNIAGNKVQVVPCTQIDYQNFVANFASYKKAGKIQWKKSLKCEYLAKIEAKEEQEKMENIIFKTVHDPHYNNPDPSKYSFEVVLYNAPLGTTLEQVKNYFKRAAEVLVIRHEPSPFDQYSCKVYVSFGNYLDAFRAIRLKGRLDGEFVYKHIASESPKLDCSEAILEHYNELYLFSQSLQDDDISIARLTRGFSNIGGLYFADKIGPNEFVVIFRDYKFAKKACAIKKFDKLRMHVACLREILHKTDEMKSIKGLNNVADTYGTEQEYGGKSQRPLVLLSDILAANLGKIQCQAPFTQTQQETKYENKFNPPEVTQTSVHKQEKLIRAEIPTGQASIDVASSSTVKSIPTQSNESSDLRNILAERRTVKTDCQGKINDLEEMERIIKEKEMDIRRRLEKLERDEANVTALLPSKPSRSQIIDDGSKESSSSNRRSGVSQRDVSPGRNESGSSNQRIVTYTTGGGNAASGRLVVTQKNRSISPSDRLAHERYVQIREEKIAITQELDSLRQRFDYRKSSRVGALQNLLAGLDREQRDIQIQLEAKRRFRMQDDFGYSGTSFDNSPSPVPRREHRSRSISRSHSPYQAASRSRSRLRTRSRSRSRSRSSARSARPSRRYRVSRSPIAYRLSQSPIGYRSSRSPTGYRASRSPIRYGSSRSPNAYRSSRNNRRRTNSRSRSRSPQAATVQRGVSLERDMYNIGRYNTRHGKFSVYVANISSEVKDNELENIFSRYGKLDDIDFTRRTRYAELYFDYTNREDAFKALEMNNVKIGGRRLRVSFNMEKPSNREKYSLYFRVRKQVAESTIYRSYETYGEIDFIWYPEGVNFGTVSFRHAEHAKQALEVRELIDGTHITTRPFIDKLKRGE